MSQNSNNIHHQKIRFVWTSQKKKKENNFYGRFILIRHIGKIMRCCVAQIIARERALRIVKWSKQEAFFLSELYSALLNTQPSLTYIILKEYYKSMNINIKNVNYILPVGYGNRKCKWMCIVYGKYIKWIALYCIFYKYKNEYDALIYVRVVQFAFYKGNLYTSKWNIKYYTAELRYYNAFYCTWCSNRKHNSRVPTYNLTLVCFTWL